MRPQTWILLEAGTAPPGVQCLWHSIWRMHLRKAIQMSSELEAALLASGTAMRDFDASVHVFLYAALIRIA